MTLERVGISEEQLMHVRERTLTENYQVHDTAQDYLEARLEQQYGWTTVQHGDDAREASEVFFGDGPDVAVYDGERVPSPAAAADCDEAPLCYIEIKSKRLTQGQEWYGRLNRRHWNSYVEFADEADAPVFVYFALVDEGGEQHFIAKDGFVEVTDDAVEGSVTDVTDSSVVFDEDDVEAVPDEDGLCYVDGDDVLGIQYETIVAGIPDVHGNDVLCLDQDEMRNWQWLSHRCDPP